MLPKKYRRKTTKKIKTLSEERILNNLSLTYPLLKLLQSNQN